jgi:hypothetical protein
MSSITKDERELEIIEQWKELRITLVEFQFDCGGDSMGSTEFTVMTDEGSIDAPDIVAYFEDEIYRRVDFYEASDGQYQGESGIVEITLVEEEGEESYFQYDKQSTSQWSESYSNIGQVELTQEEADFIKTYIRSIQGGSDDSDAVNYSQDFIMSDKQEEMLTDICERMNDMASELEIEGVDDGAEMDSEWYRFEYQNIDGKNNMHVEVTKTFTVLKEGE